MRFPARPEFVNGENKIIKKQIRTQRVVERRYKLLFSWKTLSRLLLCFMLKEIINLCLSHLKCKVQPFNSRIKLLSVTWLSEFWQNQDRWRVLSPSILSYIYIFENTMLCQWYKKKKKKVYFWTLPLLEQESREFSICSALICRLLTFWKRGTHLQKPLQVQGLSLSDCWTLELLSNTGYQRGSILRFTSWLAQCDHGSLNILTFISTVFSISAQHCILLLSDKSNHIAYKRIFR